jgi:hypothetical protein
MVGKMCPTLCKARKDEEILQRCFLMRNDVKRKKLRSAKALVFHSHFSFNFSLHLHRYVDVA